MLGALLLLPSGWSYAETVAGLNIQATLGFSDTYRLGHWAPLTVTVNNRGPHRLGELQVSLTYRDTLKNATFTKTHRRTLDLARNSRKRLRFTVFIEAFAVPLEIRVVAGDAVLARHSIELRRNFTRAPLLLVLSRDANLDYLNDSRGERLRVVYPHPELLPDHWQGYDAVAAVVVHGVSLETLGERQYEALQKWLAQGGRLVVSGGPDYSLLRRARLAELLPAAPLGLVKVSDAAALGEALGAPLAAAAPFQIHRLQITRGRVLHQSGDLPLVVQTPQARGAVAYLSFDIASPPFDRWDGMPALWSSLLQLTDQSTTFTRRELRRESPVPAVLDRRAGGFFDHGVMLIFLALYFGVLMTVYRMRPAARARQHLLTAVLLACPMVFTPAAYFLFATLLFPVGPNVVIAAVIEPFESGPYAKLSLDLGMYSRQRRSLRLAIDSAQPRFIANHRPLRWGTVESYSVHESRGSVLEITDSRPYVLHMLQAQDIIPYDVKVSALRKDGGIEVAVRNNTGQSWIDAWLVTRQQIYRLGALAHENGAVGTVRRRAVELEFAGEGWRRAFVDLQSSADVDSHVVSTVVQSVLETRINALDLHEALLMAVVPTPLRLSRRHDSWQRQQLTVALFRVMLTGTNSDDVAG